MHIDEKMIKESPNYKKKERMDIIQRTTTILGEKYLIISMEEIAELIEVISENVSSDKINSIHTAEEIVDVCICSQIIQLLFHIDDTKVVPIESYKGGKKSKVFANIVALTNAQQTISKYLRGKMDPSQVQRRMTEVVGLMQSASNGCMSLFKVNKKTYEAIFNLKMHRMDDRMNRNELS